MNHCELFYVDGQVDHNWLLTKVSGFIITDQIDSAFRLKLEVNRMCHLIEFHILFIV